MLAELPDDPGGCVEHFRYPVPLRGAGEKVRVLENSGLRGREGGGEGRREGGKEEREKGREREEGEKEGGWKEV